MPHCLFRIRPNTLLSLWYTLLATLVQAWLLFLGFERYRLYTEMQWPTGAFPRLWLTIYAALLGSSIPLLALFLAFGLLKLGNLASDNEKLGARRRRTIQLVKGGMGQSAARSRRSLAFRLCHFLRSLWTHGPPSAQSVHLLLALVQLFAQQTMLAQLYRFGFINSGDFLNTELDFLFQRARQLATNLPMGETRLQSFRITSEELAASPLAPNLLPILMHARLFGIPLEFVNLLVALIAFSTAYPAVFWRASRPFSLLFSLFLLVHSANILFTYLGFSVLFRIQETNFYSPRPVGMGQHLWALRQLPLFHPLALVGSFWLVLGLQQFAPIALYAFGYSKFVAGQARFRLLSRRSPSSSSPMLPPPPSNACSSPLDGDSLCNGLTPHVFAITLLLLVAAAKAPTFYALGMLYYKEDRPFLLCCVMVDLAYMFVWVLLWCLLTIKCQWRFRVHYDVHELISLQDAHKMAEGNIERHRSPAELKNALLIVHGDNLFLTDDPMAKPAIMRQVLRNCAPQHHADLPNWLRSAAAQMANNTGGGCQSMPGTQSPQRRMPNGPMGLGAGQFIGQRTPEMGRHTMAGRRESPPVPLAAPPYQRMSSLPPSFIDNNGHPQQQQANPFGTLQAKPRTNEYAAFIGPRPVQQIAVGGGTLSRSFNSSQTQPIMPPGHNLSAAFAPENYATIHRRSSKSSAISANSSAIAGPPTMASPHLLRSNRSNSLAPARNGGHQNGECQQTIMAGAVNGGGQQQQPQQFGTITERGGGGEQQQRRHFDGFQQQQERSRMGGLLNGVGVGDPPIKRVDIQVQQNGRHQQMGMIQRQAPAASNTFGAMNGAGGGVWQQEFGEGASLNDGTTPTTGSVTVGSSRVGSAASNTSQATFERVMFPVVNGGGFTSFGQPPSADYGTLTRREAGEMGTLKKQRGPDGAAAQWRGAKLAEAEFATSVV